MSSRRTPAFGRAAGLLAGMLAWLAAAGAASAQVCSHPTPFAAVCRYVVNTPDPLDAVAVGRVARDGPRPRGDLVLRIDGQVCGTGAASGAIGHGVAHARCVVKPGSMRMHGPTHVAEAEFFGLRDARPVSLDISLGHHGGLLTLPVEAPKLAPRTGRRKWFGLAGR